MIDTVFTMVGGWALGNAIIVGILYWQRDRVKSYATRKAMERVQERMMPDHDSLDPFEVEG